MKGFGALVGFFCLLPTGEVLGQSYALRATPLRARPAAGAPIVDGADANQDLRVIRADGEWVEARMGVDVQGWLPKTAITDHWIQVFKQERKLVFGEGNKAVRTFKVALGAHDPTNPKRIQGDGATPEGRYFIAQPDPAPEPSRYGARSLRLSYPSVGDARRGLADKIIDRATYLRITRAVRMGEIPPQNARLGGSIRIHGGGSAKDWTLGCIALEDKELIWLFDRVGKGTRVDIYASEEAARRESAQTVRAKILQNAKAQLPQPALYSQQAIRVSSLKFPGGDIDPKHAVCTDIIIRALRPAGLDLQALIYEDRSLHPDRYPARREPPNPHIDHRRVRNLVPFFRRFAISGAMGNAGEVLPGDIVIFDTGVSNGTPYDHIGIVDDVKDADGTYQAINIWTVGYRTASMPLVGKAYPKVVAWFRLGPALLGW